MPSATFQSLQVALDRIADAPHRAAAAGQPRLSATLDGLTVVYEVNDSERTLSVINILQAGSGEGL